MALHQSGENYLETIWILRKEKGNVRSVDLVERLAYSKSSVSKAVNILKAEGYVEIDEGGNIIFTEIGKSLAKKVYQRHKTLKKFLIKIGVDEETAEEDACKIEHIISDKTFEKIKKMV